MRERIANNMVVENEPRIMNKEELRTNHEFPDRIPLSRELRQASRARSLSTIHYPRYFTLVFLLLISFTAYAQDSASVKTQIDKTHILIGEPIRLGVDVRIPSGVFIRFPQPDTIPHFVILGKASLDSVVSGKSTSYHLEWKLTSFDSGIYKIPALPLLIGNRHYLSDSLPVEVSYGNLDSAKEYHDIRNIIEIENPAVKYILWVVLGLTILAIILFVLSASRPFPATKMPEEKAVGKSSLSAFDEAMASLERLKKMSLADAASVKKYYSGMNDALRVYLNRSMQLVTMERTNEELILQLSNLEMQKEAFTHLAATLRMSDFVKFAKYIPDVYDNERNLEVIRSSILLINEIRK